jgi:hypothetical protein
MTPRKMTPMKMTLKLKEDTPMPKRMTPMPKETTATTAKTQDKAEATGAAYVTVPSLRFILRAQAKKKAANVP